MYGVRSLSFILYTPDFFDMVLTIGLLQQFMNDPSPALLLARGGGKISSFSPFDKGELRGVISSFARGLISMLSAQLEFLSCCFRNLNGLEGLM
jgi:hypothetical protein